MLASFYGPGFHGNLTASGSVFNQQAPTAAHKSLPFGTKLRVCYRTCEVVTITDRGPFIGNRELDLSLGTAQRIGLTHRGVDHVKVTYID
jgi:rare lipoprotein A